MELKVEKTKKIENDQGSLQKLQPKGLIQICKVVEKGFMDKYLNFNCQLVFENEDAAKEFKKSFQDYVQENEISSIRILNDLRSDAILKLDTVPKSNFYQWFQTSICRGQHMLNLFAKYCDITGVSQSITEADGSVFDSSVLPEELSKQLKN